LNSLARLAGALQQTIESSSHLGDEESLGDKYASDCYRRESKGSRGVVLWQRSMLYLLKKLFTIQNLHRAKLEQSTFELMIQTNTSRALRGLAIGANEGNVQRRVGRSAPVGFVFRGRRSMNRRKLCFLMKVAAVGCRCWVGQAGEAVRRHAQCGGIAIAGDI
jgi:hypothetical protein